MRCFFLNLKITLERGRSVWVYLFTVYFLTLLLFIFFCHIFKLLKGEGGMGFIFFPFLIFCIVC
jgi:hypothetical protein